MKYSINHEHEDHILVVVLEGDLDLGDFKTMLDEVGSTILETNCYDLLVDVTPLKVNLSFLDLTALPGMMLSVIGDGKGGAHQGGMVFRDGVYDLISECRIDSDWDENDYQTALHAAVRTEAGKSYEISGRVLSLIPLRNRRTSPDGVELNTRITEGFTEYKCNGQVGYGMSEYLDQIVDGKPTGALR